MRPEVKILFDKCDDLYRECIRIRDHMACQITGWTKDVSLVEVSHYVTRDNKRVRWDPDNACLVDKFLHRKIPEYELRKWYREKFPERVARVDAVKIKFFRVNEKSLEPVYERLRTWKAELEGCITEKEESI